MPTFCSAELRTFISIPFAIVAAMPINATAQNPTGLWMTIDDGTKKPKAHVRIVEESGVLRGMVVKSLDPADQPNAICELCTDERKDKPIIGMTIIRQMKKNGTKWDGGDILDPNNGKVYRAQLTLSEDNKQLSVRGYIGTPLLGRSQTWTRVE